MRRCHLALSLKAILGLDGSGFELGMKRAQSVAKKFSNDLGGEATSRLRNFLTLAAAEEGMRRMYEYAGRIADMSEQLDISTTAFQQWEGAVGKAGGKAENVAAFFESLAASRKKALGGDAESLGNFQKFGIGQSDLKTMRLEDLGLAIGNAVKNGDTQSMLAPLKEIGGKGATKLVAAFKAGLEDEFKNVSIIPPEKIAEFDALGDRFQGLGKELIVAFTPFVLWLGRQIDNIATLAQVLIASTVGPIKGLLGGKSFSEVQSDASKAVDDIISKWEGRKNPEAKPDPSGRPDISGITSKQKPMPKGSTEDFFSRFAPQDSAGLNINALQQMGALVRQSTVQSDIRTIAQEAKAIGYTVKELLNEAKRPSKAPPGFDGRSVQY